MNTLGRPDIHQTEVLVEIERTEFAVGSSRSVVPQLHILTHHCLSASSVAVNPTDLGRAASNAFGPTICQSL